MSLQFFPVDTVFREPTVVKPLFKGFSSSSLSSKYEGAPDQVFRFQVLQQLTPSGREVSHLASICFSQYLLFLSGDPVPSLPPPPPNSFRKFFCFPAFDPVHHGLAPSPFLAPEAKDVEPAIKCSLTISMVHSLQRCIFTSPHHALLALCHSSRQICVLPSRLNRWPKILNSSAKAGVCFPLAVSDTMSCLSSFAWVLVHRKLAGVSFHVPFVHFFHQFFRQLFCVLFLACKDPVLVCPHKTANLMVVFRFVVKVRTLSACLPMSLLIPEHLFARS